MPRGPSAAGRARAGAEPRTRPPRERENLLLRRVDWRFLLRAAGPPSVLNLATGTLAEAASRVGAPAASEPPQLAVVSRPTRRKLARARAALAPGGELYCEWRLPRPGGIRRVRRALHRAGFVAVRVYWPGPWPAMAAPHFWLALDSAEAIEHLLATRAGRGRWARAARRVWALALRAGALAPLCVVARSGEADGPGEPDGIGYEEAGWLLLTPGAASISKVVGIPFPRRSGRREGPPRSPSEAILAPPEAVVKFARVADADAALRHEAQALRALESRHPAVHGAPRVLRVGRRAGRDGLVETALHGRPLMNSLSGETFAQVSDEVVRWLITLAGAPETEPRSAWWPRLVEAPLQRLGADFAPALDAGTLELIQHRLESLGELPIVFEHRDCAPWNIIRTAGRELAFLDWESAEPRGLPALDLVYFLANAAFVVDRALERRRTGDTYARLLDPRTRLGATAQRSLSAYAAALGLDPAPLPALRLLCWLIHTHSEVRHLQAGGEAPPAEGRLRAGTFFGLLMEELRREPGAG
jgi:Ser/Thr protein kinase RdoA (MazF antagonist)